MAAASMGLSAAGMSYSAVSAYYAGKTQKKIANYNAKVSRMQADQATEIGAKAEFQHRIGVRRMIGAQRAGFAGQGVSLDDGSALEIAQDTAKWGEVDSLTIRNNAALQAWGYEQQALGFNIQGQVASATAMNNVAGTLLTGSASLAKQMADNKGRE